MNIISVLKELNKPTIKIEVYRKIGTKSPITVTYKKDENVVLQNGINDIVYLSTLEKWETYCLPKLIKDGYEKCESEVRND